MNEETSQRLAITLAKLRKRLQQIRDKNAPIGEEGTKAGLINPLLAALGWDVEDNDEVRMEYRPRPKDNPVDYALFERSSPLLFVEAKALDTNVDDDKWIKQTVIYAGVAGVEWCILTNGDEYRFYNALAKAPVEKKLFRKVRISDPGQDQHVLDTLELLSKEQMRVPVISQIWNRHFVDGKVKAAVDDLFGNKDKRLLGLLRKKTSGLRPADIRSSLQRAIIKVEFPPIPIDKGGRGKTRPPKVKASLSDLIDAGLLHPPVELERQFKGKRFQAKVEQDGTVVFDGKPYNSLSTAGGMAKKRMIATPSGKPYPPTNGWDFWKYQEPGSGKLLDLDPLRQEYLRRRTPSRAQAKIENLKTP